MKIELDLDYEEAAQLRGRLLLSMSDPVGVALAEDLIVALDNAIQNEDERRGVAHAEQLLESGGTDDSRYREQMRDAGRGHLLR